LSVKSVARELFDAAGVGWDEPTSPAERELYFGEVVPTLMRDIVRNQQFQPRFDALVVDEAQDHDTSWPGSESDKTECGWWEVYWKLLRENRSARMAIFYDPDQRQLFRNKAKGLDSLAVIMIDVEKFDKLATAQEQMDYFMGASRARQLLVIFHRTAS
jgi:hypothetical protein